MSDLWLYVTLPFISAVACLYLLKRLIAKKSPIEFLLLFANLALVNAVQSTGYLVWPYMEASREYFADAYLITVYFLFSHLLLFAFSLSGKPSQKTNQYFIYILPGLLSVFHLSGLMVDDYRIEGYTILHNDGEFAFAFDLFLLFSCITAALLLWMRTYFRNKVIASKNMVALISFVPLIMAFIVIGLLSTTEHAIPVIVIVPAATLYAALSFYYLHRERVVRISIGIRFLIQRLKIANMILEMGNTKQDIRASTKAIEKHFISEALACHQGKIQEAADYLGMNHTTLRNKIKEYDVSVEYDRTMIAFPEKE